MRTVIGRSELWRSLRADSVQIALRRVHFAAAEIEAELEVARAAIGLVANPYASRSSNRPSAESALSILVEKVAERLTVNVPVAEQAPAAAPKAKTLGEVYDLYTADPRHTWCERTRIAYRTTRNWVMEFFGEEIAINEIAREQARGFVQLLTQVPRHADRKFPGLTIVQAVEAAKQRPDTGVISIANVNAYLNKFSGVLNWAVEEGYLDKSPAKGLRLPDPIKKRDKRRPFSIEQLRRIFSSPLYTGCVDDVYGYAKVGDARPRRARFWIPLIALFSGMRMNEICQLKVGDIRILDGVQCFVVIEDGDKRVKTAASERAIPIHQELIRIGFLAFVDEQRAAGQADLFHELSPGPHGYRSTNFSKWFSRFLVNIGASEPLTCFHSFRHCFRDALRESRADREVSLALGGWTSSGGASGIDGIYGSGFRPVVLRQVVDQIGYAKLCLAHLTLRSCG
ncbi:site-specific integrase [Sphingobium sp. PNB]|nr:site-specific integrase [Sphingobium sp. PNB]